MKTKTQLIRASTASRWIAQKIKDGGRRVTVILDKTAAERLERLQKIHGSQTVTLGKALEELENVERI